MGTPRPPVLVHAGPARPSGVDSVASAVWKPSHREMLVPLDLDGRMPSPHGPSAVVVPTSRPHDHPRSGLLLAAELAHARRCPLVVVVSKAATGRRALQQLAGRLAPLTGAAEHPLDVLVLRADLPSDALVRRTSFEVDDLPISTAYRRGGDGNVANKLQVNDVGRKRNLALLLARALRWESLLFLDDDVFLDDDAFLADVAVPGRSGHRPRARFQRTLDAQSLARCVTALGDHDAIGWTLRDYDDNSVVCRVRAHLGDPQDQFIGGGALLVRVTERTPFFPAVYNEDWLFLLGVLRAGRERGALAEAGSVHQNEYDGLSLRRARSEELGDVLGEGLLSLSAVAPRDVASVATPRFWVRAMAERHRLVTSLLDRVPPSSAEAAALEATLAVHVRLQRDEAFWAAQFSGYAQKWVADLRTWRGRLRRAATSADVLPALLNCAAVWGPSGTPQGFVTGHLDAVTSRAATTAGD